MSGFGKRNVGHSSPRQQTPRMPARSSPQQANLISKTDLKALDAGQMPVWTNMSRMKLMGLALFVVAMVLGALTYYGPEVARDLRYVGTFNVAYDLRATGGTCKRYVFLVSLCDAKIHSAGNGQPAVGTHFLMFFRGGDGAAMIPVRSSVDATAVGIQFAVSDVLLNRTLSLIGVTLFFGWIAWMFLDCLRKGRYKGGPAHDAVLAYLALRPVPV
jgi:hypothetical protein